MTETRVRTLTAEQSLRLLGARRAVPAGLPADLILRQAAVYLASILGAAVVFAGWRDGHWSVLSRSIGGAELRLLPDDDRTLDELTGRLGDAIAVREVDGAPWTLAHLPAVPHRDSDD